MLEIMDVPFKPKAYRKAARSIETLSKPIEGLAKECKLDDIAGVGSNIAKKIDEIVRTDKLKYYEDLKKELPFDFESLMGIEGLGPKTVKLLYEQLKIKNLKDLEVAAKRGKIKELYGMGEKTENEILKNIEFARKKKERRLLGFVLPIAEEIINDLKNNSPVSEISVAGSLRRMCETIGDVDILVTSTKPNEVIKRFAKKGDILAEGPTKCSIRLADGLQVDLRVLKPESYGSALQYFTGSKVHNIAVRRLALKKGYKLSEYGLFKGPKMIAGRTEQDVYEALGLTYIEPELRENTGELEASNKKELPKLIGYDELKGDLQVHTNYSDGINNIKEMALEAKRLGLSYLCITDHTNKLKVAGGMSERQILAQGREIAKINKSLKGIRVLHGAEVNILDDGKLDISQGVLKKLELVLASVHSKFKMSEQEMTDRIINAMSNEYVNVICHPTGRLINERVPYSVNLEKLFEASKKYKTFLELNAYPSRLDLNDVNARAAIKAGCKLLINSDAHSTEQLKYLRLGIGTARRAWAESKHIINTLNLKDFIKAIKK